MQSARIDVDGRAFVLSAPDHRPLNRSEVRQWLLARAFELTRNDDMIVVEPTLPKA